MSTLERLKELYNRDFPADATEENNAEYKQFIEDLLLVFPQLLAVVKAGDRLRDADEAKDAWDQAKAELEGE